MMLNSKEKELLELDLLIQVVKDSYGWDFTHYKKATLRRSAQRLVSKLGLPHISDLIPKLLWNDIFLNDLICNFSIPVSDFFRDPSFFLTLRKEVMPILKTYPFIKIWHAGCASGEEVYSMAILLQEEGMYERSRIYGTDINLNYLQKAKAGIFDKEKYASYEKNYKEAGGKNELKQYFHHKYDAFIVNNNLRKNIFFFDHNLVNDQAFGEMNLILCRNVLIYFDRELQENVLKLFDQSLCFGGFLCLGTKESLYTLKHGTQLCSWHEKLKIYRKNIKKSTVRCP